MRRLCFLGSLSPINKTEDALYLCWAKAKKWLVRQKNQLSFTCSLLVKVDTTIVAYNYAYLITDFYGSVLVVESHSAANPRGKDV